MDPYLEGELWSTFHSQLAVKIAHALNPRLAPKYVAFPEKYQNAAVPDEIGITLGSESVFPDVAVLRTTESGTQRASSAAVATPPLKLDTIVTIPVNHVWIKILDVHKRLLVTAIEFLSPTNKRGPSRRKYLRKRQKLLLSQAHLMEIDLLRVGHRVPMADPLPSAEYFVLLSRAGQRPATDVWPIALAQPLPEVTVPLLAGDADVPLNLQQVFTEVYDLGGMAYAIDYRKPPDVALTDHWANWADELLRSAGKRPRSAPKTPRRG
jgi:hypothetical protein